jgi:hypothetical protein
MRTPIPVNRDKLQQIITQVESEKTFKNLGELWREVADRYNKTVNPAKPISHSVVGLRIREWNLTVNTKPGKKGGDGSHLRQNRGKRRTKAEVFASDPAIKASLEEIRKVVPERFQSIVDRIISGSRTAGVHLRCLDCCAWQTVEVRKCRAIGCGLWPFRPYKESSNDSDDDDNDNDNDNDNDEDDNDNDNDDDN